MDRSRAKRIYYYDNQDYDREQYPRTRPRYNNYNNNNNYAHNQSHYPNNRHRGGGGFGGGGGRIGGGGGKTNDSATMVTTSYRILCSDSKVGGVIGKSGSIIKAIRQHTGAYINVLELVAGDDERVIEISDTRRRDPDGRLPAFSPAQEALFLIHDRILESVAFGDEDGGNSNERVVTRLIVSKMHVGSLLGKGGRIIEQMRNETRTHIRVLPRDHSLPRCVSLGEEIVQIVGDEDSVKNAISIISSRLRESQHRDRSNFQGRNNSDDRYEDDFVPSRRDSPYNSRSSSFNNRNNAYASRAGGHPLRSQNGQASFKDIVFRILCPNDKVDSLVGESSGIMDLLQNEIGVDVKVSDHVEGSEERIITVSSNEGSEDELFPAQEALLHIQTRIVDLVADNDNIVTTRLLVASREIGCLREDGSLSELNKLAGVDIEIVPKEKVPAFISANDSLVQIVGEIKVAREAIVEVTAKLRSHLYKESLQRDNVPPTNESETPMQPPKDSGRSSSETSKQNENDRRDQDSVSSRREDVPTTLTSPKIQLPMVTRSTLEVAIPEYAVARLLAKSKNKLAQISELSGAKVTLVEDEPDSSEKIIRISGTPDQAQRAQSLLQGFFLSIQEDGP